MNKNDSRAPQICGCGCTCPLSTDHLRGVKYVTVEGKPVLINMTCYKAAYGEEADILPITTKESNHA